MKKKTDLAGFAELIYEENGISRAQLAEKTHLVPSYITLLVRRLQRRGWLLEGAHTPSKGGRRRVLLHFQPELAHVIGVQFGRLNCRIVVTDFLGKVLNFKKMASEVANGQEHAISLVHHEIKRVLAQDPKIQGLAIAHTGVIDPTTGSVLLWPRVQGWRDVPLRKIFEDAYGLTTVVEDSSRTLALAEKRFGLGVGQKNFVCVHAGVGIGAAIFVNGQLYYGNDGVAGELGHTTIEEGGEMCSCGNRGCLEVSASGSAIIDKVRHALRQGVSSSLSSLAARDYEGLTIETIAAAAESNDRLCQTVLAEAGNHLGTALANVVNLLNPKRIILGGATPRAAKGLLLDPLLRSLKSRAFHRAVSSLEVMVSELGEEAPAVGACLIATKRILRDLCTKQGAGDLLAAGKTSATFPAGEALKTSTAPAE